MDPIDTGSGSILKQPKAVWATAGASVVAFMGIGLVDPILPSIAEGLDARRYHGLQRVHGAVHVALPGIREEAGSPDPAPALRAPGFTPHRAPRS